MTAHVSKEQLGLMMPGTMSHYFRDEPEYLEAPRAGLLASLFTAVSGWIARRAEIEEVSSLTDAQLADIGITRAEAPLLFNAAFAARRNHDRMLAVLQAGRIAGV